MSEGGHVLQGALSLLYLNVGVCFLTISHHRVKEFLFWWELTPTLAPTKALSSASKGCSCAPLTHWLKSSSVN